MVIDVYQVNNRKAQGIFVAGTRPISHGVGRWVRPSVGPSVGLSHFIFFGVFELSGPTAPALMFG